MANRVRARISCLKRHYGWRRTLLDGIGGAETWCGWGVLAHNSVKIASLIEAKQTKPGAQTHTRTISTAGAGSPTGPGPPGSKPESRNAA